MDRKKFIKTSLITGVSLGAGASIFSSCQLPVEKAESSARINFNEQFKWRMVSVWPKNFPVFGEGDVLFADLVRKMSGGRLDIKLFAKGELVPALESFDTVQDGTADIGSGCAYYWIGKAPSSAFFATSPFGMNAQQHQAWLTAGGGYELWKDIYADFNLLPMISGSTGVQMGGWFNKRIDSASDLKGLKMRIPGIGGKALEKAGGAAMNVPGGEIYTNLERGVIDATEWVGPYHDFKMGFPKVAKYYYTPGWHEPGTQLEIFVNTKSYNKLPGDLQEILFSAAARIQSWMLAELDVKNAEYLIKIKEGGTEVLTFPLEVLKELKQYTLESIDELVASDDNARKVADSYYAFKKKLKSWTDLTEKVYYNTIQEI